MLCSISYWFLTGVDIPSAYNPGSKEHAVEGILFLSPSANMNRVFNVQSIHKQVTMCLYAYSIGKAHPKDLNIDLLLPDLYPVNLD